MENNTTDQSTSDKIAQIDELLTLLAKKVLGMKEVSPSIMNKIDKALDDRLELMELIHK